MALLMAALPLAVLFVVAFPAAATGFVAGAAIRTALPRELHTVAAALDSAFRMP